MTVWIIYFHHNNKYIWLFSFKIIIYGLNSHFFAPKAKHLISLYLIYTVVCNKNFSHTFPSKVTRNTFNASLNFWGVATSIRQSNFNTFLNLFQGRLSLNMVLITAFSNCACRVNYHLDSWSWKQNVLLRGGSFKQLMNVLYLLGSTVCLSFMYCL